MMLSVLNSRVYSKLAPTLTRSARIRPVVFPQGLARSFLTTATVEESAKAPPPKKTARTSSDGKPKKDARDSTKATGKEKKNAKKSKPLVISRDKAPPKAPPGSFILFTLDRATRRPKVTTTEAMIDSVKETSQAWYALSDAEKASWNQKASELRAAHNEKLKQWHETTDPLIIKEINRRRVLKGKGKVFKPRDPDAPKRPSTPFMQFVAYFRTQYVSTRPGMGGREVAEEAGKAWRALSTEEKEVYYKKSREDFEIFHREQQTHN